MPQYEREVIDDQYGHDLEWRRKDGWVVERTEVAKVENKLFPWSKPTIKLVHVYHIIRDITPTKVHMDVTVPKWGIEDGKLNAWECMNQINEILAKRNLIKGEDKEDD
jgi:hypothetical protein